MEYDMNITKRLVFCLLIASVLFTFVLMPSGVCQPGFPSLPGDANGDGKVNIDDIFYVLAHWGEGYGYADVNFDGIVNIDDIFFILAHWT